MKIPFLFFICFFFLNPLAGNAEPVIGSAVSDYSADVFRVIFSLCLVLLIFYVGVVLFKKYAGGAVKANSAMKIIGGMSLTPKDKLLIVEAGRINLLLGVSSNGITKLHIFEHDDLNTSEDSAAQSDISFSSHLQKIIKKS